MKSTKRDPERRAGKTATEPHDSSHDEPVRRGTFAPAAMDAATPDETGDSGNAAAMGAVTPRGGALHHQPTMDDAVEADADIVTVASDESFPASDPPSYSRRTADDD